MFNPTHYKYYKYDKYYKFIGKKNDFNCNQLKSLLKCGFVFLGRICLASKLKEGIAIVEGGRGAVH